MTDKVCDVVLDGGGVKGIGLVGALSELEAAGYSFRRVAGTSAGSIVGSLLAAGWTSADLIELMKTVDYTQFRDRNFLGYFGWPGEGLSLILTKGLYRGNYLRDWLGELLAQKGVRTFADLRLHEPWANGLPPEKRYKLVVVVSDVSRGRLVQLPWDYHLYGLDPDKQLVADAVRASASTVFFYEPAVLGDRFLVDGGLLSSFPIEIFDHKGRWPTFGIKLSTKEATMTINPVTNSLNYTTAILETILDAHDRIHIDDPAVIARTIFVDTKGTRATHFDISPSEKEQLFESGRKYAKKFLATWDFSAYKRAYHKKR
jgi:NTE family protein